MYHLQRLKYYWQINASVAWLFHRDAVLIFIPSIAPIPRNRKLVLQTKTAASGTYSSGSNSFKYINSSCGEGNPNSLLFSSESKNRIAVSFITLSL
mmetsp:Transcript_21846/g.25253  ORF Transcript_21846/g.25253 Transcript_21846/m.25253 type:complete len:96 (+) Transcript_21846:340-627(+)